MSSEDTCACPEQGQVSMSRLHSLKQERSGRGLIRPSPTPIANGHTPTTTRDTGPGTSSRILCPTSTSRDPFPYRPLCLFSRHSLSVVFLRAPPYATPPICALLPSPRNVITPRPWPCARRGASLRSVSSLALGLISNYVLQRRSDRTWWALSSVPCFRAPISCFRPALAFLASTKKLLHRQTRQRTEVGTALGIHLSAYLRTTGQAGVQRYKDYRRGQSSYRDSDSEG
jgi:hypothetical protein